MPHSVTLISTIAAGLGSHRYRRLIEAKRLVIRFAEEKHAAHPGQTVLLVRDRDLLRPLMLPLVLVHPVSRSSSVLSESA